MSMKFGTGRGKKVHLIHFRSLDNEVMYSACGRRIDDVVDSNLKSESAFCGNCKRTLEYKNSSV